MLVKIGDWGALRLALGDGFSGTGFCIFLGVRAKRTMYLPVFLYGLISLILTRCVMAEMGLLRYAAMYLSSRAKIRPCFQDWLGASV